MTMTAVAVQQNGAQVPRQSPHSSNMSSPHHSRPQSYSQVPAHMRQEIPIQNGTSGPMNARPAVSNDPVHIVNGHRAPQTDMDLRRASTMSVVPPKNRDSSARRSSLILRPTSAADSSQEESDVDKSKRRPRPLLRSKSDYGPRKDEEDSEEDNVKDWGARHGFEDHYASEEYVAQLANVSRSFLKLYTSSGFIGQG
jgi:regulator-associated protein of mTOR